MTCPHADLVGLGDSLGIAELQGNQMRVETFPALPEYGDSERQRPRIIRNFAGQPNLDSFYSS